MFHFFIIFIWRFFSYFLFCFSTIIFEKTIQRVILLVLVLKVR